MLRHPELLDRVFRPSAGTFPEALAREILGLHFPPADHKRYELLSAKAQEGALTPEEQGELDDYLSINDLLTILKAKAQASLRPRDSAA